MRPPLGFFFLGTSRDLFLIFLGLVGVSPDLVTLLRTSISLALPLTILRSLMWDGLLLRRLTPEGEGEWLIASFFDGGVPSNGFEVVFLFFVFFFVCCCSSNAFRSACLVRTGQENGEDD